MSENHEAAPAQEAGQASAGKVTLTQGRGGIVGVKAGMTQFFDGAGNAVGVTVIDLQPNTVTAVRTKEKHGYCGVQLGVGLKKEKAVSKPEKGQFKTIQKPGFYYVGELRFEDSAKMDGLQVGQEVTAEFLKPGDLVDLVAVSKGKGFQGVMKRYHFGGMNASHGVSVSHRSGGSIGNRADPAKVFKGKKMAGHMGHVQITIQNVRVVNVDLESGILLVHGSVPGPKSGFVVVRKAVKKSGSAKVGGH